MKVTDFDGLRQLLLVEEFKAKVNADLKLQLDDQKVVDLKTAAVMADNYALTHKKQEKSGYNHKSFPVRKQWLSKPQGKRTVHEKVSSQKITSDKTDKSGTSDSRFTKFKQAPVCYNCKKPGHLMSDCYYLKKEKVSQKTPVGLVNSKQSNVTTADTENLLLPEPQVKS